VFRNRRNKFLYNLKNPAISDQIPEAFERRINELGLLEIKNPNF
jgi:hypothetical protein